MTDASTQTASELAPPESSQQAPVPRRAGPWRWLGRAAVLAGTLLAVPLLLLVLVASTQTGLRFALAAVEDLLPGRLAVEQADGRILGRLELTGVRLRLARLEVRLGTLVLDWRPLAVVAGRVPVNLLAVTDLDVVLAGEKEAAAEPIALPDLDLPLLLDLREARLEGLRILRAGEGDADPAPLLEAERIGLVGRWQGHRLEVRELTLALAAPRLLARAEGQADLTGAYPLTLDLSWGLDGGEDPRLAGLARLAGELGGRLTLEHELTGVVEAHLLADVEGAMGQPAWEATLAVQRVDLPALGAGLPPLDLGGRLATSGNLDQAGLTGRLDVALPGVPDLGRLEAFLDLGWQDGVLRIERLAVTEDVPEAVRRDEGEAGTAARLAIAGRLALGAAPIELALAGTWEGLRWPLAGPAAVTSPQGQVQIAGTLDALVYALSTTAAGAALPELALELRGTGDRAGARIAALDIATLGGRIAGTGQVRWQSALDWALALSATDLDPGIQWPLWSGAIQGQVTSAGTLVGERPEAVLALNGIGGVLRGYPVAATGAVVVHAGAVRITDLAVTSGPSRARVAGLLGERLDLDLALTSPDLSSLYPEAAGSLEVTGALRGTPARPEASLQLAANGAELPGVTLASLVGTLALGLEADAPLRLDLTGEGLGLGAAAEDWGRFTLRGTGTTADHRLGLELRGPRLDLTLAATGGLAAEPLAYRGSLTTLELSGAELGDWRLARPSPLEIAPPALELGPLCLRDAAGSNGCVEVARPDAASWRAALDLPRLDLARLGHWLPETLEASGFAQAEGRFEGRGDRVQGTARLTLPQGRLGWLGGPAAGELFDLSGARLVLEAADAGLQTELKVPVTGLGALEGRVMLPGWRPTAPTRPDQPLRGELQAEIQDLGRIGQLVPDLTEVRGQIAADLALSGTVASPAVQGGARLGSAGFAVPLIGLQVTEVGLEATAAAPRRVDLRGSAMIGGGRLDLTGEGRALADGWETEVQLTGTDLRVADTSEYRVRLSPDIQVRQASDGVQVRGEIRVPEATIRPRSLPAGTVTPSADVVLRDGDGPAPLPLDLDLRLVLGDAVSIDAFGVRGALRGDLRVLQAPGRDEPLGDGQLQIVDGTYRISGGFGLLATVGKPLTIEQGRLVFAKTPLANPGLLLQAQREGGDLTAGVQVLGTLREPKLTFFSDSDPGMTQSEISNYLITGIPPRRGAEEENRALAVGTYVAPKLYMEYVTSSGDEADKVRLRYELMKNIELQTETGDAQGADIFFKLER